MSGTRSFEYDGEIWFNNFIYRPAVTRSKRTQIILHILYAHHILCDLCMFYYFTDVANLLWNSRTTHFRIPLTCKCIRLTLMITTIQIKSISTKSPLYRACAIAVCQFPNLSGILRRKNRMLHISPNFQCSKTRDLINMSTLESMLCTRICTTAAWILWANSKNSMQDMSNDFSLLYACVHWWYIANAQAEPSPCLPYKSTWNPHIICKRIRKLSSWIN